MPKAKDRELLAMMSATLIGPALAGPNDVANYSSTITALVHNSVEIAERILKKVDRHAKR